MGDWVVLVDDDEVNNFISQHLLLKHQFAEKVLSFESSLAAFNFLNCPEILPIKLVLLDINMPEMDGWEFLERYQQTGLSYPICMLSASVRRFDYDKALQSSHVIGFLAKPLSAEQLQTLPLKLNLPVYS